MHLNGGRRGVGDLTVRSPCGLECSYLPPVIPSTDPEYGSNVPPECNFRNPYWIGWKSSFQEEAIVQGPKQGRKKYPRPLTAPEVIALVRRCPNVEELGLMGTDDDDEDEETYSDEVRHGPRQLEPSTLSLLPMSITPATAERRACVSDE